MKACSVATYMYWRRSYPLLLQSHENMMEISDCGTCYLQVDTCDTCLHISGYSSRGVSSP